MYIPQAEAHITKLQGEPCQGDPDRYLAPLTLTVKANQGDTGLRTLMFLMALGVGSGLFFFGSRCAVLLGVGSAHLATREDSAGYLARRIGRGGSESLGCAAQRAACKIHRMDLRHTLLCSVGECVFGMRAALGTVYYSGMRRLKQAKKTDEA